MIVWGWCRCSIRRDDSSASNEPPDAEPHVRWCERGPGNPAPYSIVHGFTGSNSWAFGNHVEDHRRHLRGSSRSRRQRLFGRLAAADDVVAAAMIDRLVHHAEVLTLSGDSYRTRSRRELLTKNRSSRD